MTRKALVITLMLIFTVGIIALLSYLINPIVVKYSKSKIHAMTIRAVNEAISQTLSANTYATLTIINRSASGKIDSLQTDAIKMNEISGKVALLSQAYIESFSKEKLNVPIGTFSGIPILTGRGFNVPLRVVPIGQVYCGFKTEFIGQGVNQTIHRIVLTAKTTVNLIMPLGSKTIESEIDVLLCENVIVGEVPEFFLGIS